MTEDEAIDDGYQIDRHTYPWTAYLGPRFDPDMAVQIATPAWP